jgi:hypothetical protein
VVILPAFGVTMEDFERLREIGCIVVDTTCGSVLNVWKRVESYARDGFTALIHGKHYHEETKATASQVNQAPGRQVPHRPRHGRGAAGLRLHRAAKAGAPARRSSSTSPKASPGFDPDAHLSGSASRTRRRCSRASRWRSRPRSAGRWSAATASEPGFDRRALPLVRHHLLGDAGAAGRGAPMMEDRPPT